MCDLGKSEIWREILLRLPAESLFRLSAVCKRWRTIIRYPGFVKAHTKNQLSSNPSNIIIRNSTGPPFAPLYYFNLQDLSFEAVEPQTIPVVPLSLTRGGLSSLRSLPVAACDGLLLTPPLNPEGDWEIRNPLTRERLKLPKLNIDTEYSEVVGYGIGYDSVADDYKVVVIDCFLLNSKIHTHVYSLKSDSWKKIGDCPFGLLNTTNLQQRGVFLNGALHWLSSNDDGILVLDVGTESYRHLAIPDFERRQTSTTQLEALSGCLFFTHRIIGYFMTSIEAWVMSDDGREDDSWKRLFFSNIFKGGDLRPLVYLKNKRRVFLHDEHEIFWLDFERSETLQKVNIHAVCGEKSIISAQAFVGSLFRPHDSCGRHVAVPSEKQTTKQKKNTGYYSKLTFSLCERTWHGSLYSYGQRYRKNSNWYHQSCHGGKEKICLPPFTPNDTLSFVPLDICREIFFRLPAKSLIRFRAVCVAWRAILDDPAFVKAHTNKQHLSSSDTNIIIRSSTGPPFYCLYSLDLDDLDFTDSLQRIAVTPLDYTCRGLLCTWDFPVAACNGLMLVPYENAYEIWNPLTRECLKLPQPNIKVYKKVGTGLGYDCTSDDYKVVVITTYETDSLFHTRNGYKRQTHIYSLRMNSWRNIGDVPWPWYPSGVGVFFCGVLHWILPAAWEVDSTILSLNLGTESYREMQLPLPLIRKRPYLSVLGDCLILSDQSDAHFGVWVMKGYGDEDYSWLKIFSIDTNYKIGTKLRPVTYMKDKTQVFLQDDDYGFYVFDLERNSMKKVCIHGQSRKYCAQFVPGSIFRLRDNCGATGKRRRTIKRREKKMKLSNTELYFCVRDAKSWGFSHDVCHSLDPDWNCLSGEED